MWALRAAVRPVLRLPRLGRGCPALRAAPPPPWTPAAAWWSLSGPWRGGSGLRRGCRGGEGTGLSCLHLCPALGSKAPPPRAGQTQGGVLTAASCPAAEWQVAEATALVHTLDGWSVVRTMVVSTKTPGSKLVFGKGNFQHLTVTPRRPGAPHWVCRFLQKELEAAWGVQVFDRFTVVLHIFRCHARTREARLQVALAEVPLLRSNLRDSVAHLDRHGGGSRYIMGSGESFMQLQQRLLREKEAKLRRALERLRRKRRVLRRQRARREFPVVSVVGYTNCGEWSRRGGAIRGDAAHARLGTDLIVHVRDVSHPEAERQKASVLAALRGLRLPDVLLDTMVEVHNKVDLVPGYSPAESSAVAVSALLGLGLEQLKAELEDAVLRATGRRVLTLRVRLAGDQLSWLHREAAVQAVDVVPEDGAADVKVLISNAAYGKFRKLFPG
uniref:GTP binding protein 6 (putative) n=1 Tax=Microcebus murinus TaxID=30608 RepID=A0A8C5Y0F1_MICMU